MLKRISIVTMMLTVVFGLTLLAGSSFSGGWSTELLVEPAGDLFLKSLGSIVTLNYSFGNLLSTSESEFILFGFIWQGVGISGTLGAFDIQGDVLFGPSTADYLYAQMIASLSIAGIDLGFHFAQLSDVVLGGPADGFALRIAGDAGVFDIVSITEFGARIRDDDFDGITIYHAATGLHKSYVTDPVVTGQGFTGEKITLGGLSFGCVENISTTLYMTCTEGFDWVRFDLADIDSGLGWLTFDLEVAFQLQTKSVVLAPALVWGETACFDAYLEVRTGAPDDTIYDGFTSINGINFYGFGFTYSWNGVTVKELTVLDTHRYAITTPAYGSVIEGIAEAVDQGHEYYPDYWELFSIEVTNDGCCGGITRFLANTYFDKTSSGIFGWGMTYVGTTVSIGPTLSLSGTVEVDTAGLNHLGMGVGVSW
jgi:hypothetical protein